MKHIGYNSYFDKLAFQEHIDIVDFEKMFKFADLYPSSAELKESKDNVLKCKINLYDYYIFANYIRFKL